MDGYFCLYGEWPEHLEDRGNELTLLYMYTLMAIRDGHPEMAYLMAATLTTITKRAEIL